MIPRSEDASGKALKRKDCGEIEGTGDFSSSTEMGRSRRKRIDWPTPNLGLGGPLGLQGRTDW